MKRVARNFGVAFLLAVACPALAGKPDAALILKKAEEIRNPQVSYTAESVLSDVRKGKDADIRTYAVFVKDGRKTLVNYLSPETERGTKVLMVDGDMYVALPGAAKPIKIAPRQKLVGNAAYGDIARLDYDKNYNAKYVGENTLDGKKVHVLELTPKPDRLVTYDLIEYWAEVDTGRPVRAFYKSSLGKTLREALFSNWQDILGVKRPLTTELTDHLDKSLTTTIELRGLKAAQLPETLFQRQNLK